MIEIEHYVGKSNIEGAGLFTAQDIQEGEVVYRFDYRFVMIISEAELRTMHPAARNAALKYSYRGRGVDRMSGAVYYCADDSRFLNHSENPNIRWVLDQDIYVATCFIPAGTEITCDYREFCEPEDYQLSDVGASA